MESRTQLMGHALHPLLVTFPLGSLGFSVASDALHAWTGERRHADAARQALDFGLLSSLAAIPFGTIDYLAVRPGTRARRVGLWHGLGNVAMLGLFAASRWMRAPGEAPAAAKWLSASGFVLSGVTGWLGAELMERHGIGIHDRIGQDAPSSLSDDTPGSLPYSDDQPTLRGYDTSSPRAVGERSEAHLASSGETSSE